MNGAYDYIVVGAGSAGCPVASRLTENPDVEVLLLEAGPADNNIKLKVPAAFIYNYTSPQHNWIYYTGPDPHMGGRRVFCPRGKQPVGNRGLRAQHFRRSA